MKPGDLLLNSRESAICPDPEPNKIQSMHTHPTSWITILLLFSYLSLGC
jgi:hypothetical protein